MSQLIDYIIWTSSNSPYAPVTRVRVPEGTIFPAVGVWQRVKAAGETIYILDTTQSAGDWLAWAIRGRVLCVAPEDGLKPIEEMAGNHYDLLITYVLPGTAVSLGVGYKRRQRLNIKFLAPGESRQAHADDFAAAETLLP